MHLPNFSCPCIYNVNLFFTGETKKELNSILQTFSIPVRFFNECTTAGPTTSKKKFRHYKKYIQEKGVYKLTVPVKTKIN